ncbi:MAG: siderophore-interacting protein [Microcella sp.]
MPYDLTRHPFAPAARRLTLAARTVLATAGDAAAGHAFVRVRLAEAQPGELAGFIAPGGGDHVRVEVVEGADRTETVVAHSVEEGWIDLDILVHASVGSASGVIGPWAAEAPIGSPVLMHGPKGSVVLTGAPGEVVLAGDDSALPAVRRYLGMLGPSITGHLLLETVFDPAALGLVPPPGLRVSILRPDPSAPSAVLAEALSALPPPADPLERFVFACGEQSLVAPARAALATWGIDVERAVVKGYWRR